jgi:nucleoid DNA-binding protein
MNKRQFVDKLSQAFETSKVNAEAMLETFITTIETSLLS